jgi:hypothetical protein
VAAGQPVSSLELKGKGARRCRRESAAARREKPLNGRDPGHGCGTKQARQPDRGANRREAENAWGRNEAVGLETYCNTGVPCAGAGEIRSEARVSRANDQWTRAGDVVRRVETLVGRRAPKGASSGTSEAAPRKSERQKRMPFENIEGNGSGSKSGVAGMETGPATSNRGEPMNRERPCS